jgi:hypothetical protein
VLKRPRPQAAVSVESPAGAGASAPPSAAATQRAPSAAAAGPSLANVDLNQHLTVMCLEVMARTRGTLLPDPRFDAVLAVGWAVSDDDLVWAQRQQAGAGAPDDSFVRSLVVGAVVAVDEPPLPTAAAAAAATVPPPTTTNGCCAVNAVGMDSPQSLATIPLRLMNAA